MFGFVPKFSIDSFMPKLAVFCLNTVNNYLHVQTCTNTHRHRTKFHVFVTECSQICIALLLKNSTVLLCILLT